MVCKSSKGSEVSDARGTGSIGRGRLDSSIPSERLEQEAQRLGFRERVLVLLAKDSPQQMQIRGSISSMVTGAPIGHVKRSQAIGARHRSSHGKISYDQNGKPSSVRIFGRSKARIEKRR